MPRSEQPTRSPVTASNVPPYLRCGKWRTGWCSEGGRGTADSEKNISSSPVLEDGWRAIRLGLHIRTAVATASQRCYGEVWEGKEPLCPRRGGLWWQHHLPLTGGRQRSPGFVRPAPGSQRKRSVSLLRPVDVRGRVVYAGRGLSSVSTAGRSECVWSRRDNILSCVCVSWLE